MPAPPVSGLLALHSNRTEYLFDAVELILDRYRLDALEPEVMLVQSNGIAEWLKMALAHRTGISAATSIQLPGRFQWSIFRRVLGPGQVPDHSPLDKTPLGWRLMRLLADLPASEPSPDFASLRHYLDDDDPLRRHQLALRIADLLDQYQVHRPDWLRAWAAGRDVLIDVKGTESLMPADQRWQARLWQRLIDELSPDQRRLSRDRLHQQVIERLTSMPATSPNGTADLSLPRRVVLFGISQLPMPMLELLSALSRHTQVVLAVLNPCRFYWADIMDGREWIRYARRRHPLRHGQELSGIPFEQMHQHAHPLLAAWGRQARDFVRQLDAFDDAERARARFALDRTDLFDEDSPADATLLEQVQNHIRDLSPIDEHPRSTARRDDRSIVFHIAHSPVRELEILHDQLLTMLAEPPGARPLRPRDIVVMVPAVDDFAAAIRAVFGQYDERDPRHIPFDITDLSARGSSALLSGLQWVLHSPQERCRLSDLCALIDVPAIATRFGIEAERVPQLARWMEGAGIRWGLDREHRVAFGLDACGDIHTARFGLRRMMMGYAVGADPNETGEPFDDILAFDEVGGLEAGLAGSLAALIEVLNDWRRESASSARPAAWALRLRALLGRLTDARDDSDRQVLAALDDALERWLDDCQAAAFDDPIPLAVAREAWLQALDSPSLGRRFRGRGVTFCTLMPMRAIPFEVVCLLGMNDGDYPRGTQRSGFDLIARADQRRPGDRARRDDDRQMFLEALLSARRVLYLSWCGRNTRDDSEQPASVLVSQLRDYLSNAWSPETVRHRTTTHPLQAFSRRYFEEGSAITTYAHEWRIAHQSDLSQASSEQASPSPSQQSDLPFDTTANPAPAPVLEASGPLRAGAAGTGTSDDARPALTITALARFVANPVRGFFRERLGAIFDESTPALPDDEPFAIEGLDRHTLIERIAGDTLSAMRATALVQLSRFEIAAELTRRVERLARAGALPIGGPGERSRTEIVARLAPMLEAWRAARLEHPVALRRLPVRFEQTGFVIDDWIDQRFGAGSDTDPAIWLELDTRELIDRKGPAGVLSHRLIAPWIRSLLCAASRLPDHGIVIGRDCVVRVRPSDADRARADLATLIDFQRQGLAEPLPVAVRTALAWVGSQSKNPTWAASQTYDGSEFTRGEVRDPALARCFPDFQALSANGRFEHHARGLYGRLFEWADSHLELTTHAEQSPPGQSTVSGAP